MTGFLAVSGIQAREESMPEELKESTPELLKESRAARAERVEAWTDRAEEVGVEQAAVEWTERMAVRKENTPRTQKEIAEDPKVYKKKVLLTSWLEWREFHQNENHEEVGDTPEGGSLAAATSDAGRAQKLSEAALRKIFKLTPLVTPRGAFTRVPGTKAEQNLENKSHWEKDTAGHGGAFWKVWLNKKSWEQRQNPYTLDKDGKLLRLPKGT